MSSAHLRNEVTRNSATPHPPPHRATVSRAKKVQNRATGASKRGKKTSNKKFCCFPPPLFCASSSSSSYLVLFFLLVVAHNVSMSKGSLIKMERKKSTEIKLHTEARLYESIEKEALFSPPLFFCFFVFYEYLNSLVCSLRPRKTHVKNRKKNLLFFSSFFPFFIHKKRVFKEKALNIRRKRRKT